MSNKEPDVFPAPAGINRYDQMLASFYDRVPRASGDKPAVADLYALCWQCSPRQRG
ncbi:hypothetical protein JR375_002501 [Salmonella enterica subsp. enterica serovar Derby]|nr:hypothetical protein [Salmonella enterica subsp. enterica serovar Derby]EGC5350976.1 hypothetical protein [Salmonella enterica]EGX8296664.1 hypothetical protein [Salmonella enterica subsp. enterica serovar Derby]EHC7850657.1 hypothetical protein [Salmonella enterica subsp. enterica serovar Derby]EHE3697955.1 hypothetical protein [Salmonella enterica subsp. enterica serovar Derby]